MNLTEIGKEAKESSRYLGKLGVLKKNEILLAVADELIKATDEIIKANEEDVKKAVSDGMKSSLVDRLKLTPARIEGMADGLRQVASLEDPVGEVLSMTKRPNGMTVGQKRVPLGVVCMIYEARPNVTSDAFALCFKTGNAVILKGGSDAINSNIAVAGVINRVLTEYGVPKGACTMISSTDRSVVGELLHMNDYIDVVIPRGGAGLISYVVANSSVPVIETGTGNCHVFVDDTADFDMALNIIENAKTQRIGVCNACESLVVSKKIAKEFIPLLVERLKLHNVEIRGDELSVSIDSYIKPADESDYSTEYLDYKVSLIILDNIDEAISHINRYNTGHSETIVTNDYSHAEQFLDEVDAACVYVNASTRFTDGHEFGFGAEIGISTQKLHARGPMGLKALTTTKYIIYGNGQIRP